MQTNDRYLLSVVHYGFKVVRQVQRLSRYNLEVPLFPFKIQKGMIHFACLENSVESAKY